MTTQGTVGWLCPKCSAIISPYQTTCSTCAPSAGLGFGTKSGPMYTFTSGTFSLGGISTSGTFVVTPPKSDAQKLEEAKADAADWRDKFDRLIEAMQEVIEEHQDDDED